VYSEVGRERDGKGFVEYETQADLRNAVEKLDNREFKGSTVRCVSDVSDPPPDFGRGRPYRPYGAQDDRRGDRFRSRSPPGRRGYMPPPDDYDYRRPPPRGYSPRREDYRRRSPPSRGYYDDRDRYPRSPPHGARAPSDDYPPRPRYPNDAYGAPPPRRGYEPDPYMNGHGARPYDAAARPPSPGRRPRSPPGRSGYDGYERRAY